MQTALALFKVIGHVVCIIDLSVGQYVMFNHSGSQIWLELMRGKEPQAIVETLHQQYPNQSMESIKASIDEFVGLNQENNLFSLTVSPQQLEALSQEIFEELGDFIPSEFIPPEFKQSDVKELKSASAPSIVI